MKIWYKIVEEKNGKLYTLFHGNQGARELPIGKWVRADSKEVHDGSKGTRYMSGWHVIASKSEARRYLKRFDITLRKLRVIPCRARNVRPKSHSRYEIYLAKDLFIPQEALK